MDNLCSEYQHKMIDIIYGEEDIDQSLKLHIEQCEGCRKYWEDLNELNQELSQIDLNVPIEYSKISLAFKNAEAIRQDRFKIKDFFLFMVICSMILVSLVVLSLQGYLKQILYLQIGLYFIVPVFLPIIIKIRCFKERYNE